MIAERQMEAVKHLKPWIMDTSIIYFCNDESTELPPLKALFWRRLNCRIAKRPFSASACAHEEDDEAEQNQNNRIANLFKKTLARKQYRC